MQWNSDAWLWALGRTTLMVAVSAVIVAALLSLLRVRSTALRRAAWMIVLLQGWLPVQVPIVLERQAAPAAEPVRVAEVTHAASAIPAPEAVPPTSEILEQAGAEAPRADATPNVEAASPLIAQTTLESTRRAIPWTRLLFLIWSVGALMTMTLGAYRYLSFLRRLRSTELASGDWQDEFQLARAALGIETPVELRVSNDAGPCLVRRLRGSCVVVPRGLWMDLTRSHRLAVLRHELAHHTRGDLWKSIAIRLLSLPQWFNPAAWWAVRRFDECAEWACDELAAGGTEGATEYSKLLLALGAAPGGRAAYLPAAHRGCVATRIRRLVAEPRRDVRGAKLMVPLVIAGLVGLNLLRFEVVAQTLEREPGRSPAADSPARLPWHPEELVAVLGEERGSLWSSTTQLVVTRDGRRLIGNGGQSSLFIYDAETLSVIGTFGERPSRLMFATLSQDGTRLIAGYLDGTMTVWNIAAAEPELEQTVNVTPPDLEQGADPWYGFAHALRSDRVAITVGNHVVLWELAQGRLRRVSSLILDEDFIEAAVSPDGQRMVTKVTIRIDGPVPPERSIEADGLGYVRLDCRLQLWDIAADQPRELSALVTPQIENVTFTPDGRRLMGSSQSVLRPMVTRSVGIEDDTLLEQANLPHNLGWPFRPAFSADGRLMANALASGGVQIADTAESDWPVISSLDTGEVLAPGIAFSPTADRLYVGFQSSLQRWDRTETGDYTRVSPQPAHSGVVRDLMFSADGASLHSVGGTTICEWDLRQTDVVRPVVHQMNLSPSGIPAMKRWAQRNAILCLRSTNGEGQRLSLLDEATGAFDEEFGIEFGNDYRDAAWCFDMHPDGKLLATGHWDRAIRFWNVTGGTPRMIAEFSGAHSGHVCDLAFSSDGTMLASAGWDHAVKLWDTSTDPPSVGGELGQHEEIVRTVAFSRDSRWLASGDEAGVIRLWDLKSRDLSGPTIVHPDDLAHPKSMYDGRTVNTLEFSADGRRLLSADGAGRVVVWSVPSGEIIKEWTFPGWVWAARWSPDESLIATGNQNGTVYLLAAPE